MSETSANNKRIAKNTLVLYVRMLFLTVISLYTSRVVLQVLGVEDYGIYNVVGGIVSMMGVVNGAMSVSTQRFLTFEIGRGDSVRLKQVFSMCLTIYILLAIIFLILGETIGLWFLNNKLVIPDERMLAGNWVFQCSLVSTVSSLLTNPFNAVIISREKMGVYAYISILDAVLRLVLVYVLLIVTDDKLIVYGFMLMLLHILVTAIYFFYCRSKYQESRYKFYWETSLFRNLLSYTGWNLFGSTAAIVKGQGLNVLLNMFFNPSVNAARGLAYQVNSAVSHFFTSFYTAVRPQITKYYAQQDLENMFKLVFRSSKLSFFLILLISLPLIIEAPFIIQLWLGQLPEYVIPFMRIIIIITAVDAMATPLMTTAHATGKIALYQSIVGTSTILNIPISYVLLNMGAGPLIVFQVSLGLSLINLFLRLLIVKRLVNFPVREYIIKVFGNSLLVAILASIIPFIFYLYISEGFWNFIVVCLVTIFCSIASIWLVGMSSEERTFGLEFIRKVIKKK